MFLGAVVQIVKTRCLAYNIRRLRREPGIDAAIAFHSDGMFGGCNMSKAKKWIINIILIVVVTAAMLLLAEAAMRWLDGYQMSHIELQQDVNR